MPGWSPQPQCCWVKSRPRSAPTLHRVPSPRLVRREPTPASVATTMPPLPACSAPSMRVRTTRTARLGMVDCSVRPATAGRRTRQGRRWSAGRHGRLRSQGGRACREAKCRLPGLPPVERGPRLGYECPCGERRALRGLPPTARGKRSGAQRVHPGRGLRHLPSSATHCCPPSPRIIHCVRERWPARHVIRLTARLPRRSS